MPHQRSPCRLDSRDHGRGQVGAPSAGTGGADERKIFARSFHQFILVRLLLFELPHAIGRTSLDSLSDLPGSGRELQKSRRPSPVRARYRQPDLRSAAEGSAGSPSLVYSQVADVLSPRPVRAGFAGKEAGNEFLNRRIVFDLSDLAMIVVLRDDDVARVANDVDDARIARIEALMALDNPRPRHPVEIFLARAGRIGNQAIDVRPGGGLVRKSQVGQKKAGPGVAGFRK